MTPKHSPLALLALLVWTSGCVDSVREDWLEGQTTGYSDGSGSVDASSTAWPQPEPTSGTSSAGATEGTSESTEADTQAFDLGDPPVIASFEVPDFMERAGPLLVDADVLGSVHTQLIVTHEDEGVVHQVDDPEFPWEWAITSDSFDADYTFELRAWSQTGALATQTRPCELDIHVGGVLDAEWQHPGPGPSSASAIDVLKGDGDVDDSVVAAIAVFDGFDPTVWLYRWEPTLQHIKMQKQVFCNGQVCRFRPRDMAVDANNNMYVVGWSMNTGAWMAKVDVFGDTVWNVHLPDADFSGVAVDEAKGAVYVSGWRNFYDQDQDHDYSDGYLWVYAMSDRTSLGQASYHSTYIGENSEPFGSLNRPRGVAVSGSRVVLAGETTVSNLVNEDESLTCAHLLEYSNGLLVERYRLPQSYDQTESSYQGIAADGNGGLVVAGWYITDLDEPKLVHHGTFAADLTPASGTLWGVPEGMGHAVAAHPEHVLVAAGEVLHYNSPDSRAWVASPKLWGSKHPYVWSIPGVNRAIDVAVDRYGWIYYAGENDFRALVQRIRP